MWTPCSAAMLQGLRPFGPWEPLPKATGPQWLLGTHRALSSGWEGAGSHCQVLACRDDQVILLGGAGPVACGGGSPDLVCGQTLLAAEARGCQVHELP